jgi:aminoglycoside 3-N-acetyltransferase
MDYTGLRQFAKRILPDQTVDAVRKIKEKRRSVRISRLQALTEEQFREVLIEDLRIAVGDVVFVHSSTDGLNLAFPATTILTMLRDLVGPEGTLLFPTYPKRGSYDFLMSGQVFDVRKTPSYMGLITELARRHKEAVRSLHPTKSVVAIGRRARELTQTHCECPYPYGGKSPYAKIREYGGKIVGIGVSTARLSCVHCVEDHMRERFPVQPYHDQVFAAPCIDYDARVRMVETYAHDMRKLKLDLPKFMKRYVDNSVCADVKIGGLTFFRADACKLFANMVELARNGVTIYPRFAYQKVRSAFK